MARNGSGTYVVPNTFSDGEVISATDHNENFSDIGTALTNSLATDGQSPMTAPLKASAGSVAAPSLTFSSDTDTGRYHKSANTMADVCGGAEVVEYSSTGVSVTGAFAATGAVAAAGALSGTTITASGAITGPSVAVTGAATSATVTATGAISGASVAATGAVTGATVTTTGAIAAGNGLTVSAGTVSLPAGSVASAALASPPKFSREYVSAATSWSMNNIVNFNHGLGVMPKVLDARITPVVSELGYPIGEEVPINDFYSAGGGFFVPIAARRMNSTLISFIFPNLVANGFNAVNASLETINPTNWRLIVRAWA